EVGDPAFFVNRDFAPRVHAARSLPCIFRPGVTAELAGAGNRVECPDQLAAQDVISAQIARRIAVSFAGSGSHNDQVLEHPAGRSALDITNRFRIPPEPFPQIDASVLAERVDGDAGLEIDLLEIAVGGEDEAAIGAVLALPVIEASIRGPSLHRVRPDD